MVVAAKLLAFDSSSGKTGWALMSIPLKTGRKVELLKFGHFNIRSARTKNKKRVVIPIPKRLVEFGERIEDLIQRHTPAYIAFEEHHISKLNAAKVLLKFMGVALEIAYRHTEKEIIELTPREIRTQIGVNWMGRDVAKEMVKQEVEKFFKIEVETDDESDAIALAMAAAGRVRILEGG